MFNKEDMTVSLIVAEAKIEEAKVEHRKSYNKLKEDFINFINETKEASRLIGEVKSEILRFNFPIGLDTGFKIDNIKVYSGDEIRLSGGKVGVAIIHNEQPYWKSNKECGYFNEFSKFEFVRHFTQYKDGEEIAIGRHGAEGFIVSIHRE